MSIRIFAYWHIFIFLFGISIPTHGQSTLEKYISYGLENNLALQEQQFNYEKSVQSLREARGLFMPDLSLQVRFSIARGGRVIEFPIGDLLNPVYGSINQILQQLGQPSPFPEQLENQEFLFFREMEQETKLRLIQPIVNPAIVFNYKLQEDLSMLEATKVTTYKRQLIADIQNAYYQYLIAEEVLKIYEAGLQLLDEQRKITQKLIDAERMTVDAKYRIQAEISSLEADLASRIADRDMAAAYFNFLLNKPLNADIEIDSISLAGVDIPEELATGTSLALLQREEISQLNIGMDAGDQALKIAKSSYWPTINAVFDYGIQGVTYSFGADDDFFMGSLVLQWNIFKGLQNKAGVEKAKLDLETLDVQLQQLTASIELEVTQAWNLWKASAQQLNATKSRIKAAEKNYELVLARYENEKATLIELLDAQTSLLEAQVSQTIAHYNYLMKQVEYQRVTASSQIDF